MTTTHTPGPWVENISKDGSIEVWNADYSMFIAKRHQMNDRDEAIANARLIAAAPDLLASLEAIIGLAEYGLSQTIGFASADKRSKDIEDAYAVIAKAKGE